jgi:hypothetical protein
MAGAVALFVLALSLAVQLHFGGVWWGGLAFVLLALAVLPYYAATTYELGEREIVVRGPLATYRRSWSEVRSYFPDAEGVLLSPLDKPSRLALTRGLYVRFGGNRDEVLQRVAALVERRAEDDGAASGADGGGG